MTNRNDAGSDNKKPNRPFSDLSGRNKEAAYIAAALYRSAQQLRVKMEKEVLSAHKLSWTAFSILYDLCEWETLDTRRIAALSGITAATASNVMNTLEKKGLCSRQTNKRDRRLVFVSITDEGRKVIEDLYPDFHQGEIELTACLDKQEQKTLSALLQKIADNFIT
ncbi:MarR family transcriptional regulator [Bacillus velezensis]|uniref:MarR family winged helix-turn-helix transcriptional regulator n=1 Tax=Bacillus velezensis TaxID=492670 RepID=UPI0015F4E0B6|nr:MarR family transcriptional regulator [Bacillus velezensis]QMT20801.1 MarR family transcriptional regulator [Bacillus velezensis]